MTERRFRAHASNLRWSCLRWPLFFFFFHFLSSHRDIILYTARLLITAGHTCMQTLSRGSYTYRSRWGAGLGSSAQLQATRRGAIQGNLEDGEGDKLIFAGRTLRLFQPVRWRYIPEPAIAIGNTVRRRSAAELANSAIWGTLHRLVWDSIHGSHLVHLDTY